MYKKSFIKPIIIVIVLLIIVYTSVQLIFQSYKEIKSTFNFPSIVEDEVLIFINNGKKSEEIGNLGDLLSSKKWEKLSISNTKEITKYITTKNEWEVSNKNNITISKFQDMVINGLGVNKLLTKDGFFLGINTLEWGGSLYFYPNGDKAKRYCVNDGYIWNVFRHNEGIYAFASYPSKNPPNGRILKLENWFGRWRSTEIFDIGEIPYCFTFAENENMYIVTNNKLIQLSSFKDKKVLIENAFWEGMFPNSIVYDKGNLYIGMEGFITKISLKSIKQKEFEVYKPVG